MQFHSLLRIFQLRRIQLSYPPSTANRSMHSEDELCHDKLTRLLANGFSSSGFKLISKVSSLKLLSFYMLMKSKVTIVRLVQTVYCRFKSDTICHFHGLPKVSYIT